MTNIDDLTLKFRLAKIYVRATFKRFYSQYIIIGAENIPTQGPVIFAPNHLNALMDALAIHSATPDNYSTVFLARSDMFRKKKVADFLTFAKIMPAFRIRDGFEQLEKNNEVFEKCVEVLERGNTMGIMPEGNQELENRIRPLVKGIFRVAFAAQQKFGTEKTVKIIPVGLDYGSMVKSQNHIIINFGEAIDVLDYMTDYNENPVLAINKLRDDLRCKMGDLVLNIDTKENYKCFEQATKLSNISVLRHLKLDKNTTNLFLARQKIGEKLVALETKNPELTNELNIISNEFIQLKEKYKLHEANFDLKNKSLAKNLLSVLSFILLTPVFSIGLLLNFLPFFIPVWVRKKLKVKFEGFFTSLQYGIGIITFPLFYLLQSLTIVLVSSISAWYILLLLPLHYLSGKWAIKIYKKFRKFIGANSHNRMMKNNSELSNTTHNLRMRIIEIVLSQFE